MHRKLSGLSIVLIRAGLVAALVTIGAAFKPHEAEAAYSIVCAPAPRGCFTTSIPCSEVTRPSTWSCDRHALVNPHDPDTIIHEASGRALVVLKGKRIYILSDALEAQFARKRPSAEEFARLVLQDRGSVSEASLARVSKDYGIPIAKPTSTGKR